MNTNALKKFAQAARTKLMSQVAAKLTYVLSADSAELREKAAQLKKLQEEIARSGKAQVIEKVAYTWFNRLMALRFMDANDFQLIGMRVLTPKAGFSLPEILQEAKQGHISGELNLNTQRIFDLLDGKLPSNNAQDEVYKELLIATCNHLHKTLPFLFERISDYTELLLPDDLTSEFSIIQDIRNGMTDADCAEVEIIGWLYQFYISEKKDEVFASKSKVKKEDIPAATQLFTPRWIVEYMVQNTVGKLWLQNRPNSKLRDHMPYYIESPAAAANDYLKLNSVTELTLLDQACGSGHILVYGFELLYKIYEEEGYNPSEIPELILTNNLFGFEIDDRAAQLASLALMLKARSHYRRFFKKEVKPTILCYQDLALTTQQTEEAFKAIGHKLTDDLAHDLTQTQQATNYGSLIAPKSTPQAISKALEAVTEKSKTADIFLQYRLEQLQTALTQLHLLGRKYHCLAANPPYMGGGKMNSKLADFVKTNYPDSKADLITCFVDRGLEHLPEHGLSGLVTMESWMFLSSFEKFRKKLLKNNKIHSLSHFGWHIMRIAFGTVAFILEKSKPTNDFKGVYSYMEFDNIDKEQERPKVFPIKDNGRYKVANQKDFQKIPGSPIGYWATPNFIETIADKGLIGEIGFLGKGLDTGDNNRFLRLWSEISQNGKWKICIKGGEFRKWYGNIFYVIDWEEDGRKVKEYNGSNIRNSQYYFKEGLSWSRISSGKAAFRYLDSGCVFEGNGPSGFFNQGLYNILGLLNSRVVYKFLEIISPTLTFQSGEINKISVVDKVLNELKLEHLSKDSICISRIEWNSRETSWNFEQNELIKHHGQDLEESYELYQAYWRKKFFELHANEEELNRQFIEIYGLQEELTPEVALQDITILKEEAKIENGQLVFQADEVFQQFISYAVGCMFGRYSLDKPGLILANQGETLEDYLKTINCHPEPVEGFLPDDDNIIPILDDEWFEDDIVSRFYAFLKASFGTANFEKNVAFVEECLGKDIRKYFVKDFYNDHIKRYKKRPIYWQFSSPKGSFNVLIYMHRYTPDTLNQILNGYLRQYREKLQTHIEQLDHLIESGSSTEQTKAAKAKEKINVILLELQEYEREVLYPLATQRISIDLDDGVLVNYNKFGSAIKEVSGLNDKTTKKKVKGFDWIDVEQIRD